MVKINVLATLFAMIFSSAALAGIGDEIYCFKSNGCAAVSGLPKQICLSSISIQNNNEFDGLLMSVHGPDFNAEIAEDLRTDSASNTLTAVFRFNEEYEACGFNLRSKLQIRVKRLTAGQIMDWSTVELSVQYRESYDNCHSEWHSGSIQYLPLF